MWKYVHAEVKTPEGDILRLKFSTHAEYPVDAIPEIEQEYSVKVLWIADGFGPTTDEEWNKVSVKDLSPKFKPADAGRYVCIRNKNGLMKNGILIKIIDDEDARVWHPNTPHDKGGQGTTCIVNISEVIRMGDYVGLFRYSKSFVSP